MLLCVFFVIFASLISPITSIGASTNGGNGGKTLYVTNYNDAGTGSLRSLVTTVGPAIISFAKLPKVSSPYGGVIALKSSLRITGSKLTIDGSSSPSGITIKDFDTRLVKASDIIIRNIRFRPGVVQPRSESSENRGEDAFTVSDSTNILIEKVTASWGSDETLSIVRSKAVTIKNCLISSPMSDKSVHVEDGQQQVHPYGSLISSSQDVLVTENIYAHSMSRNVQFQGGINNVFQNNVVFDYWRGTILECEAWKDVFPSGAVKYQVSGNYYISSKDNTVSADGRKLPDTPILLSNTPHDSGAPIPWAKNQIFVGSNYYNGKLYSGWTGITRGLVSELKPLTSPFYPISRDGAAVYKNFVAHPETVGAQPLDAIDRAIIKDVTYLTGKFMPLPPTVWNSAGWTNSVVSNSEEVNEVAETTTDNSDTETKTETAVPAYGVALIVLGAICVVLMVAVAVVAVKRNF